MDSKLIKVRPLKPDFEIKECKGEKKFAVVLTFEVINPGDEKQYGEKIYGVMPCTQYPGNWIFDGGIYYLEITDKKPQYAHDYPIEYKELLNRNNNGKEYWIIEISDLRVHCINGAPKT